MAAHVPYRYGAFRVLACIGLMVRLRRPGVGGRALRGRPRPHLGHFQGQHAGISWVQGRFNEFAGAFTLDPGDAGKSRFGMTIKTASVDTNVAKRDQHLRTADFFDVEKYPEMVFKSAAVRKVHGGLEVTGDFTLHGVT